MTDVCIDLRDVTVTFQTSRGGETIALQNTNLQIERRHFFSIVGPSGCGKSTMMLAASGLLRPSSGTIMVEQKQVQGPYTDLGIVFQKDLLVDWRDALGNVMLQVELRGQPRRKYIERANNLLSMVGLSGMENKFPWELSGGMRQRVAIARALVHDPPLLMMDEPFGALDALTRDQLNLDLTNIWEGSDMTVFFITHSLSEAVFLLDRVAVMSPRPGRIVEIIDIDLPRPRNLSIRETPEFTGYTRRIREIFEEMGVIRDSAKRG